MFPLILTILCSSGNALILKYNETRKGNAVLLLSGNYLSASVIAAAFMLTDPEAGFSSDTLVFGALLGIMFAVTFFAFAKSVAIAGTALSTVSSRLSVVIPVMFSMLIFGEVPKPIYYAGFALTAVTIVLFYFSLNRIEGRKLGFIDFFWLFFLFAGIGFNDFAMKIFGMEWPVTEKPFFLFSIFFFAFLYTFTIVVTRKIRFVRSTAVTGILLGIPNVFSSFFLLLALAEFQAIIVYPVVNISIIIFTSVMAWVFWKEKPDTFGLWSIITGLAAIVLLSL